MAVLRPLPNWTAGILDKLDVKPDGIYVVINSDALVGAVDAGQVITIQSEREKTIDSVA